MSDRLTPARIARSFHQGVTGTRRTARRAATGGLIAAFLLSIVGPAAVMASPVAVAVNDVYSVAKNVTLTESSDTGVLSNDEFSGHAKLVLSPGHGFLDLSTNGAFTYEPNADFVGTDTFTYQACVDPSSCNPTPATVTITVANTAPVTVDDVLSVSEDSDATAIDVMDNDTDDNGDALHFAAIYQPLNGLVTTVGSGSAAYLRYTPDADFHGIDTFNYTVSDSNLNSELGTVTVTVGAVNDAPSFSAGGDVSRDEDSAAYEAAWATNISSGPFEEDEISFVVTNDSHDLFATQPAISSSGILTFSLAPNANGSAVVSVTVEDGSGTANGGDDTGNTADFTISVGAINDAPSCSGATEYLDEDGDITGSLTDQCTDVDSALSFYVIDNVAEGTLELDLDGTWTYTPGPEFNGSDSFVFVAVDGNEEGDSATIALSVAAINDTPTFSLGDDLTVDEDAGAQVEPLFLLDPSAGPADESAQVLTLDVTNDNNDLFSAQPTIDLETGQLDYTPAADAHGVATVSVTLTDDGVTENLVNISSNGGSSPNTQTFTITVNAVNDAPVGVADAYTVAEDGVLTVSVEDGFLANDTDVDGDTILFYGITNSSNGTRVGGSLGGFTFTPTQDFVGTAGFSYRMTDGATGYMSELIAVVITVTAVNDAPIAVDDAYWTNEDTTLNIDVGYSILANDTDVELDGLAVFEIVTNVSQGDLTLYEDGLFDYVPTPDYSGTVWFTYQATDGTGASNTATVTITVNPLNDPVTAVADSLNVVEDTTTSLLVLANDTDPDHDALRVTLVGIASHGTVSIPVGGQTVRYAPDADWSGQDAFVYTVTDDHGTTSSATVTVTVSAVNDKPVCTIEDATVSVVEDGSLLLAYDCTDVDSNAIEYAIGTGPSHGTISSFNADLGTFGYAPEADYFGPDSLTLIGSDEVDDSTPITVTITVTSVNDAPVAVADVATTNEDTAVTGNVLNNDTDVDHDSLFMDLMTDVEHGTLVLSEFSPGAFSYTPDADFHGPDSFTYQANDDDLTSETVTVSITVTSVNDAPVAVADAFSTSEDTTLEVDAPGVLDNDTDVDTGQVQILIPINPLTAVLVTNVSHGTLSLDANGSFSYVPTADFHGSDSFTYKANDGTIGGNTVTVTITVSSVNDAPIAVANAYTTHEDTVVTGNVATNDTDVDGQTLVTDLMGDAAAHGTVSLNFNGSFSYTPDANWYGTDSFAYRANDDYLYSNTATVTITVTSVNDAPVAVANTGSLPENAPAATYNVLTNDTDVEHHALIVSQVSVASAAGTVGIIGGQVRYTPRSLFSGTAVIAYTVSDQHGGTDAGTLTVTVVRDAIAPVVSTPVVTIGQGSIDATTPIKVTWSATDAGVGVSEIQVQVSTDGLAFSTVYTGVGTTTTVQLGSGHAYRFRVRAIDAEDNVSAYLTSESRRLAVTPALSASVTYAINAWNIFRPTGAHVYTYSSTKGNSASYTFTGREIVWVGPKSTKSGLAYVYIDGVKVSTVDLYRATGFSGQQLFKKAFTTSGTHTIRVVVAEVGKWVSVDEFVVLR